MNVLVIGGNRFFGKKLVQELLKSQNGHHQVTLLNRQNIDDGFGSKVERIKCDRSDASALRAAIGSNCFDLVFDQVCYQAQDARAAYEIFSDKTSHYIFTSTQSVYEAGAGLSEKDFEPTSYQFTIDAEFIPGSSSKNQYAEAKRQCEAVFFGQKNFPVTAVRFTFVVGEDDYTQRLKWHVDRVKSGEPIYFPNLEAKIPFIHSSDAAEILYALGTKRIGGAFNASSPTPLKLSDLVKTIEETVGKKAILVSEKSDSAHSPYGTASDWYMSIEKLKTTGYVPREISNWLPELVSFLSRT